MFSVEEVIKMCEMEGYAEAVVGHIGEGLNVEQRKVGRGMTVLSHMLKTSCHSA